MDKNRDYVILEVTVVNVTKLFQKQYESNMETQRFNSPVNPADDVKM